MKKELPVIIAAVVIIGAAVWWNKTHPSGPAKPAEKAEEEKSDEGVTHDTNGYAVVHISDEAQGDAGIQVGNPSAGQYSPEIKGYGRVIDTSPLVALQAELAAARLAIEYSQTELRRMQTLKDQNNTSLRAFQAAEEIDARNRATLAALLAKIQPAWGNAVFQRLSEKTSAAQPGDKGDFWHKLADFSTVLIRVDLPASEKVNSFQKARIMPLVADSLSHPLREGTQTIPADYFDLASSVDPQTQGRGMLFLVNDNASQFRPGMAVTAFIQLPVPAVSGVIVPNEAVVRTEGAAWVYVMNEGAASFTRTPITLDQPVEKGWFVGKGITTKNYLVTAGAQTLLSEELKALIKVD